MPSAGFKHRGTDLVLPAASASVIEVGDLLWLDTTNFVVKPASEQTDQLTEISNMYMFAQNFIGISGTRKAAGKAANIRVITEGEYEFDCASATWEVGDLAGSPEDAGGTFLEDQKVKKTTSVNSAVMVSVKRATSATTRHRFRLLTRTVGIAPRPLPNFNSASATLAGTKTLLLDDAIVQVFDPGGANRDVNLPLAARSKGRMYIIHNSADNPEILSIKDGVTTICTPTQNETAWVFCDGTTWRGIVGANN